MCVVHCLLFVAYCMLQAGLCAVSCVLCFVSRCVARCVVALFVVSC